MLQTLFSALNHATKMSVKTLLGVLCVVLILSSCETDLREVNRITNIKEEEPIDISRGVTVIFSDSANVKAKMTAPEMRQFDGMQGDSIIGEAYHEFQKGVKIIFYDVDGEELQNIVSDYAIRRVDQKLVEFKGNVVITRNDGSVIKTEELIHNEEANTFYNHAPIFGFSKDGYSTFQGTSFKSDGDFKNILIQQTTGLTYLQDNN